MEATQQNNASYDQPTNDSDKAYVSDLSQWLTLESVSYDPSEVVLITQIMPFILGVGLVGNLAFLFVVFRLRWMRTVVNFYLINLAAADIIFLCVAIGEKIALYITSPELYNEAPKGLTGCILVAFTKGWCYFTSITLVTLVSVGRFYAVCRPHDYKLNSKQRALKLISGSWLVCCLAAICVIPTKSYLAVNYYYSLNNPDVDFMYYFQNPRHVETCQPVGSMDWIAYAIDGIQALPFFFAMSGNTIIYVFIFRALNERVSKSTRPNNRERKAEMRDKVSRMLIANGTIFFLCLAPFEMTSVVGMITKQKLNYNANQRTWMQFCRVLMYLNSAVNPIIYNVSNPRYRQAFVRAFSKKERKTESKSPSTVQLSHLRGESLESKSKRDNSH